ncbi:hypothetical protein R3P38DRAFT_3331733 [Favolaschia claudopus]|uniref:Tyr recombinase domain-containing protein n=1 Tax=Favolaschia claudopus TaxID=2862362 RepID=A0AAV9ZR66_9AGAR
MSSDIPLIFTTIRKVIHNANETDPVYAEEIEDDIEAEAETVPEDNVYNVSQLWEHLLDASKGVTTETDKEYRRLMDQCVKFLKANKLIKDEDKFFSKSPSELAPVCIYIDGTEKHHTTFRASYNHAQKMRAAMTYAFGRLYGLGSLPWHESESTGRMVGNPSVSETVATYMTSLRRRKVRVGETATSARAITEETLLKLYKFNNIPEIAKVKQYSAGSRKAIKEPHEWGGARARRLLTLAYVLAFLCLLRFDEVLKIQIHDIEWVSDTCIKLTLPFRKTSQFGGVKPFYLHLFPPHLAHLCPIRALTNWLYVSDIEDGFLFRKIVSGDRVSQENTHMTSECFLEMFRNNLLDITVDPAPYGTHSFRRGGCQWLYTCCRWGLRRICDWGGWSTEFSNLTIVKYLISYADEPCERREDYMNPNCPPTIKCFSCGRTCHCI